MIKHVNIGLLAMLWHPVQSRTNLKVGELRHVLIKLLRFSNITLPSQKSDNCCGFD